MSNIPDIVSCPQNFSNFVVTGGQGGCSRPNYVTNMLSEAEVNISDISQRLGVIWEIPSHLGHLGGLNIPIQDGVVDNFIEEIIIKAI